MISTTDTTFLTRVRVRNYKSIEGCDVPLGPLTFLVGPNGAGKSNVLDAVRFVRDALRNTLDQAMRERGGWEEVRRRSKAKPRHVGISLDFRLASGDVGSYSFRIAAKADAGYEVQAESCVLPGARYEVRSGQLVSNVTGGLLGTVMPPVAPDRLYLVNASGLPAFRGIYDALTRMGFYSLNPERIRALQKPESGEILLREGENLASVIARLARTSPDAKSRIEEYLERVVPGVESVERCAIGPMETLEFRQRSSHAPGSRPFTALNMSDGTLRSLGVLTALFQGDSVGGIPLVGIEEPEVALHPAAAGVLRDCLVDASRTSQVLVTSHSPELLDDSSIGTDNVLAVVADEGATQIARIDEAGRSALQRRLFTAGELLRIDQLKPDMQDVERARDQQTELFGG